MTATPVVLAPATAAADQAPLVVLTVAAVLAVLAAATGFTLWRYSERDMVDARADADRWEAMHRDTTARLVASEAEVHALRWQLDQVVPVAETWADQDRPDSLPTLLRAPTVEVPVAPVVEEPPPLAAEPRLWTGGRATVLVHHDPEPESVEAELQPQTVQPDPPARLPGGVTEAQAQAAARWHRQGRTWQQVADLLGVTASVAAKAGKHADPGC